VWALLLVLHWVLVKAMGLAHELGLQLALRSVLVTERVWVPQLVVLLALELACE
jgi:hypothetical protein